MTENENNRADQALEEALAQMAEEVPPMPADFHEKWTKAVRAEAAKTENEPETENEPKKENQSRIVLINRWTRILSLAAVFVFLIGGTLIYRSSRPMVTMEQPAAEKREETAEATEKPADKAAENPAEEAAEKTAEEAAGAGAFEMEAAAEEECEAIEAPAAENYAAEPEADAAMEAAEAEAPMLNMAAATDAKNKTAGQMNMAADEAAEEAEEKAAEEGAKTEADAAMAASEAEVPTPAVHMTPDPTQEPTPEPTQEPVPESTATVTAIPETEAAAAEKKEAPGFGQIIGDFFRDMGSFLLAVWPYLLILAVPAGAALIWRHRKKR